MAEKKVKEPKSKKAKASEEAAATQIQEPEKKINPFTGNDIVNFARETLGTPYRHQGRINGVALDCIGVAIYVAQKLGLEYLDMSAYGRVPHKGLLEYMMEKQPCLEQVYDMQAGDILQMKFVRDPQHVAICCGETMIHCSSETGRVVEVRIGEENRHLITGIFRFLGVT